MIKAILKLFAAGLMFLFLILFVVTGGGSLDPEFWRIVFSK